MAELKYDKDGRLLFTKEMKEEYTILMPQMLPVHFGMFRQLLVLEGYKVDMLTTPCWSSASSSTPSSTGATTPTGSPCSSPRPGAGAGRPTTSTCCARRWRRRSWPLSP